MFLFLPKDDQQFVFSEMQSNYLQLNYSSPKYMENANTRLLF